jgi:putative membrane protein
VFLGGGATAFLGTQGDPWDTQWDMFLCLTGALTSQALLARPHDRQLSQLAGNPLGTRRDSPEAPRPDA